LAVYVAPIEAVKCDWAG